MSLSKERYRSALHKVYSLMNKGEQNLSTSELNQIAELANAIERFEDETLSVMPLKEHNVLEQSPDKMENI